MFPTLLDSGLLAAEHLTQNNNDLNLADCLLLLQQGKWRKPKVSYIASTARTAVKTCLKHRQDNFPARWTIGSDLSV